MKKWLLTAVLFLTLTTACSSGDDGETTGEAGGAPASDGGKTVVTLSVQQSNAFYQTLEKKVEARYPDIDLRIKAYKQIGEKWEPADYEKYQKTTNTELLSGKGADIYEIGSLPLEEYVNKKLLLNMDDRMAQDPLLNKGDLETNILNAVKQNGGTYAITTGFYLRAFAGDGDALAHADVDDATWTWEKLGTISKAILQQERKDGKEPRFAVSNTSPDILFQEMVVDNYAKFVDKDAKKASFDTPEFIALMKQVNQMYTDKMVTEEPAETGKQLFVSTVLQSPADLIDGLHAYFSNPKLLQKPHVSEAGGMRIVPAAQFAIQAKSPEKDAAWQIIAFLLSESGQTIEGKPGFSLLKSVNDKQLNDLEEQVKSGARKLPNGAAAHASDEEFSTFKQMLHATTNYAQMDNKVLSIVGEEAYAYYGGQKTAEEAAKLIQNRSTTVLNE